MSTNEVGQFRKNNNECGRFDEEEKKREKQTEKNENKATTGRLDIVLFIPSPPLSLYIMLACDGVGLLSYYKH
jgi:hypothetical protein